MTWLEQLKTRVEALPGKRERVRLVGQLRKYGEDLSKAHETLATATAQRTGTQQVFPDLSLNKADEVVSRAAAAARRLRSTLSKQLEAITTSSVEKRVLNLKDAASDVRTLVRDAWKAALATRVEALAPIVDIARSAKLEGSEALDRKLRDLERREAPANPEQAKLVKASLDELGVAVAGLGLKGAAGVFLERAAQGRAHPKDLENPEVRALLDRYELWGRLSVRLG